MIHSRNHSLMYTPTFSPPLRLPWVHLVVPITVVAFRLQAHPSLLCFVLLELHSADLMSSLPATRGWALPVEGAGGRLQGQGERRCLFFWCCAYPQTQVDWHVGVKTAFLGLPAGVAVQHTAATARGLRRDQITPPAWASSKFPDPSPLPVSFLQRTGSHSLQSLPLCTLDSCPLPLFSS